MPTVNVRVTIKGLQLDFLSVENFRIVERPLPGSPVFFKKRLNDTGPAQGITDENGVCVCRIETGVWICIAQVVEPFINPFQGSLNIRADRSIQLRASVNAKDCEKIILILKRQIDKAGKTEKQIEKDLRKAKRLIKRIKGTYSNYRELPVLFQIADLEKEFPGYVPGKDDNRSTLPAKRPPSTWENHIKD